MRARDRTRLSRFLLELCPADADVERLSETEGCRSRVIDELLAKHALTGTWRWLDIHTPWGWHVLEVQARSEAASSAGSATLAVLVQNNHSSVDGVFSYAVDPALLPALDGPAPATSSSRCR